MNKPYPYPAREGFHFRAWRFVPDESPVRARLASALEVLKEQEGRVQNFLYLYYRRLWSSYRQVEAARTRRKAIGDFPGILSEEYAAGCCTLAALLEARQEWVDAQIDEYRAIATYNNVLAGNDYGKSTILDRHRMVWIGGEGE